MIHRFDLHVHSWYSEDAASPPEDLIAAARERGLSGIAITDHNTCGAIHYCLEQGLMRADGGAVDAFLVIPGVEISTADGHLLCIGTVLPDRRGAPAAEVAAEIRSLGGLAVPAHPYDFFRSGIREEILDALDIELIEVFNAAISLRSQNQRAKTYAARRGLGMTAASDAHHASAVGTATTAVEITGLSVSAVLEGLRGGTRIEERYLGRWESFKKHFGNWFRMFNSRPTPPSAE